MKIVAALTLALTAQAGLAFEPDLPAGARQLTDEQRARSVYELPLGPFRNGEIETERSHGLVRLQSWRMEGLSNAITEIAETVAAQLTEGGYNLVFSCEDEDCGGFDFRFETLVLPPPNMFVDLAAFRFLSARRPAPNGAEVVGLLVSRTSNAAMVQIISVTPMNPVSLSLIDSAQREAAESAQLKPSSTKIAEPAARDVEDSADPEDFTKLITEKGHAVLAGLSFETGSSTLAEGPFPSLKALADWLKERPEARIALVGHTDSKGNLENNIDLSRARATSVQEHLIDIHGVPPEQLEAHGIGYLAPIASNADPEGRDTNRRVEAVVLANP